MAAILGLTGAEEFATNRFKNIRRQVFYFYPNGAAPLIGLLSLLPEEDTNDPEFYWFEKRLSTQSTITAAANSDGPFTATGGDTNKTTAGWTEAAGVVVRVKTPSNGTDILRVGHIVQLKAVPLAAGGTIDIQGVVTTKVTGVTTKFEIRLLHDVTGALNTTAANGLEIWVIGNAFAEGNTGASGDIYNPPVDIGNYTQIFRTEFSITGSALKTALKYDDTGAYKDKAKEHSVYHMTEMEKCFLFSRYKTKVTGSNGLTTRTTMGVLGFLMLWEAGATYGNTAATADSDDTKRIITNASGQMDATTYDMYLERVFRGNQNSANEKLVFCGSGFLSVINQMYKSQACLVADLPYSDTFGMTVVKHVTPFGTVFYKSHPLFSSNPRERYNALFLDVPCLKYRYLQGRDTELLTERQPNNADYRLDEWFGESGLQFKFPEAFMYLQNVREFLPG